MYMLTPIFLIYFRVDMKKLGESLSDKELEDMMKQAGIDGDSHIFFTYFRVAMKKLGKSLSDKELEDVMKQADIDGDSHVYYIFQGCHEEVRRILIRQRIRRSDETR